MAVTRGMKMSRVTSRVCNWRRATEHASEAARIGVFAAAEAVPADAVNGVSDLWLGDNRDQHSKVDELGSRTVLVATRFSTGNSQLRPARTPKSKQVGASSELKSGAQSHCAARSA